MNEKIIFFCLFITLFGCSQRYDSAQNIKTKYHKQISRLEECAEDFQAYFGNKNGLVTKIWHSKNDETLFYLPEIVEAGFSREANPNYNALEILNVHTKRQTFFLKGQTEKYPQIYHGTAITDENKKIHIVIYKDVIVEKKTGLKVICRIVFNKKILKIKSKQ